MFVTWLVFDVGGSFATALVIATVMGVPILAMRNLGPAEGWRRYALLVLTIAVLAPLAGLIRYGYLRLFDDGPPPSMTSSANRPSSFGCDTLSRPQC